MEEIELLTIDVDDILLDIREVGGGGVGGRGCLIR